MSPEQEAELLERARGTALERQAAFEELFEAFRQPVAALCLHLTGNPHDAEDALQDVFLIVHQKLGAFRGEARLYTWLFRIATRVALRTRASRQRRSRREATLRYDPGVVEADPLEAREEASRVVDAMDRLTLNHRLVLSLFAIRELTHEEIAQILGVPVGTVWSRLHNARKQLARTLRSGAQGR